MKELVSEHMAAFKTIETNMSGFNNLRCALPEPAQTLTSTLNRINIKDTELIHTHQEGLIKVIPTR